jgi:hypothetical protein
VRDAGTEILVGKSVLGGAENDRTFVHSEQPEAFSLIEALTCS